MSPEKLLSKLTAKVSNFNPRVDGNGVADVSPEDVSMALSGLDSKDPVYLLIRLKYIGDETVLQDLKTQSLIRILDLAYRKNWIKKGEHKANTIKGLIDLAIFEIMIPAHCPACMGTGINPTDYTECKVCNASGHRKFGEEFKAEVAELDYSEYKKWKSRYEKIYMKFNEWELKGLEMIISRINR